VIQEYKVVTGTNIADIVANVNAAIEQGLQPYRDLQVVWADNRPRFYQVMVHRTEAADYRYSSVTVPGVEG
jgi:hypothetical protein